MEGCDGLADCLFGLHVAVVWGGVDMVQTSAKDGVFDSIVHFEVSQVVRVTYVRSYSDRR